MQFILGLFILLILYAGFKGDRDKDEEYKTRISVFDGHVHLYLFDGGLIKNQKNKLTGKFVVVDSDSRSLVPFQVYEMNIKSRDILVAKNPSEVDFVVNQKCEWNIVGTYSYSTNALQESCDFYVRNIKDKTWNHWGNFKGSMPPDSIRTKGGGGSDVKGGRALVSFLDSYEKFN